MTYNDFDSLNRVFNQQLSIRVIGKYAIDVSVSKACVNKSKTCKFSRMRKFLQVSLHVKIGKCKRTSS